MKLKYVTMTSVGAVFAPVLSGRDHDLLRENQPACTRLQSKSGTKPSGVLVLPSAREISFLNSAKARRAPSESSEWVFFASPLFL